LVCMESQLSGDVSVAFPIRMAISGLRLHHHYNNLLNK